MQTSFHSLNSLSHKRVTIFLVPESKKLPKFLKDMDKENIMEQVIQADTSGFEGKNGQILHISRCQSITDKVVLLVGLGKQFTNNEIEKIGGAISIRLNALKAKEADIYFDWDEKSLSVQKKMSNAELITRLCFGIKIRNYAFTKYYTKSIVVLHVPGRRLLGIDITTEDAKTIFVKLE